MNLKVEGAILNTNFADFESTRGATMVFGIFTALD